MATDLNVAPVYVVKQQNTQIRSNLLRLKSYNQYRSFVQMARLFSWAASSLIRSSKSSRSWGVEEQKFSITGPFNVEYLHSKHSLQEIKKNKGILSNNNFLIVFSIKIAFTFLLFAAMILLKISISSSIYLIT